MGWGAILAQDRRGHLSHMTRRLLIAALLALFGSGIACNKSATARRRPSPTPADGPIFYTAIGASDGIGFGSSAPCIPFTDCPDGTGYVQILRRRLRDNSPGRTVEHANLSIPGAVLSRAIEDLARDIGTPISELAGNFIERQAPFVPTNTTHVTIFAGGNDANVIGRAALAGRGGSDPSGYIDAQVRQWGIDLDDLVARIRSRAPERAHRRAQHDQPRRRAVHRITPAVREEHHAAHRRRHFRSRQRADQPQRAGRRPDVRRAPVSAVRITHPTASIPATAAMRSSPTTPIPR